MNAFEHLNGGLIEFDLHVANSEANHRPIPPPNSTTHEHNNNNNNIDPYINRTDHHSLPDILYNAFTLNNNHTEHLNNNVILEPRNNHPEQEVSSHLELVFPGLFSLTEPAEKAPPLSTTTTSTTTTTTTTTSTTPTTPPNDKQQKTGRPKTAPLPPPRRGSRKRTRSEAGQELDRLRWEQQYRRSTTPKQQQSGGVAPPLVSKKTGSAHRDDHGGEDSEIDTLLIHSSSDSSDVEEDATLLLNGDSMPRSCLTMTKTTMERTERDLRFLFDVVRLILITPLPFPNCSPVSTISNPLCTLPCITCPCHYCVIPRKQFEQCCGVVTHRIPNPPLARSVPNSRLPRKGDPMSSNFERQ